MGQDVPQTTFRGGGPENLIVTAVPWKALLSKLADL
jgi:hypothetical protein